MKVVAGDGWCLGGGALGPVAPQHYSLALLLWRDMGWGLSYGML